MGLPEIFRVAWQACNSDFCCDLNAFDWSTFFSYLDDESYNCDLFPQMSGKVQTLLLLTRFWYKFVQGEVNIYIIMAV